MSTKPVPTDAETDAPTEAAPKPSYLPARAIVRRVERVSPSFVRVWFGGAGIAEIGTPGDVFDVRVKLVFPAPRHAVPVLDEGDWYGSWLAVAEHERGSMRTYSIRELAVDAHTGEAQVVVDFVLHLEPGLTGPASLWASTATVGDEIILIGPRRGRDDRGGIEFEPGEATTIMLAGDETAAPAIARILEDAPANTRGVAFLEVPSAADELPIAAPAGVVVNWLPRGASDHGSLLIPTVLDYLGAGEVEEVEVVDAETENPVWETPVFSSLGEELPAEQPHVDRYFWFAGESGVVTTLRRHLVRDLGVDRAQVAFMGYWRKGVAMRG